ncbi:tryptophan 7-halogenase [Sphingomonas sp.]|jgi:tryptophan halogenase|uniref:tryptophan 7-halogenase n=1 Tax=Sphingomonas sp. TaxID=28214 RepID=UPI002E160729|nr:tryptophan 7-halogenase [Sphingomonas sp.]HEV7290000.1 tryptophan 7-halogenase [Sphingomonas sp.]
MSARAIRSVCVVGDGIVGLSAAAAFARALPQVAVTIVPATPDPAAVAEIQCATWPSIHRFHAAIGLDERELVRDGIATHLLGAQFGNWPQVGQDWVHGFGEHGLKAGDIPFHTLWHRAFQAGAAAPYWRYGAAALLGAAGKYAHPSPDPASPLGGFLYALRIDPPRYRARLDTLTAPLPRHAPFASVERGEDGAIAAVGTADGSRVTADLYLDCSGPQALLRFPDDAEFEPWDAWLPGRSMAVRDVPGDAVDPLDRAETTADGWRWRSPLGDRTRVIELNDEPGGVAVRFGRRTPGIGNVLAIGDAATAIDPLFGTALHLTHDAILLALDLLPGRDFGQAEIAEYNRRSRAVSTRMRDFHALHHLRVGTMTAPLPEGLARTLEQFQRRGRLPPFEGEPFEADAWLASLIGLGLTPDAIDPLTASIHPARAAHAMDALASRLAQATENVPPYPQLLSRLRAG